MNVFNKVTTVTLLLTISNWSFGDGHGHSDLNACNQKFTEAQIGNWEGENMFRDGVGAINTWQYVNSVTLDDGLVRVSGTFVNGEADFIGGEYALGLEWETSIPWIDEESTTVTVIKCIESESRIMRETSWKGTSSLTGDRIENIEQNTIFFESGSLVGSARIKSLEDENSKYYVWGLGYSNRIEGETTAETALDTSSETESESIWDTISGWFD